MPYDYQPKRHEYTTPRGRRIPIAEVRAEIDKLVGVVSAKSKSLGARYARGELSAVEFHIEMRELLKSGHIVAASIGRGGRARMTQADWGRVGAKLKSEYGYLAKLVRKLERGSLVKAHSGYRAQKYANGIVMSYHQTMHKEHTQAKPDGIKVRLITNSKEGCEECAADEARGWVDPEDMQELGTRLCGNFCLCDLEFSDDFERETGETI